MLRKDSASWYPARARVELKVKPPVLHPEGKHMVVGKEMGVPRDSLPSSENNFSELPHIMVIPNSCN